MIINFYGQEYFKIQFGDTTIAFNPFSKDSKLKGPKFGADLVLESIKHEDFNGHDNLSHGDKNPFVVTGPGEYEAQGVTVMGFPSKSEFDLPKDKDSRHNTIYLLNLENMNLCFWGPLNDKELSQSTNEAIDNIDILFVPATKDKGILGPEEVYKLAVKYEPSIIIPMHFTDIKDDAVKTFIKEGGNDTEKPVDKLTIKKKEVDSMEGVVTLIKPSA